MSLREIHLQPALSSDRRLDRGGGATAREGCALHRGGPGLRWEMWCWHRDLTYSRLTRESMALLQTTGSLRQRCHTHGASRPLAECWGGVLLSSVDATCGDPCHGAGVCLTGPPGAAFASEEVCKDSS